MFQVEDYVLHQNTGKSGKVVGYGHQIVDGVYLPTLIVRIVDRNLNQQTGFFEDLSSKWTPLGELKSRVA